MTRRSHAFANDAQTLTTGLVRAADLVVVVASALAAYGLKFGHLELPAKNLVAITVAALFTLVYMHLARVYEFKKLRRTTQQAGAVGLCWLAVALSLMALAYATKTGDLFSRVWAGGWFAGGFVGLLAVRAAAAVTIRRWQDRGELRSRVAIVGAGPIGQALAEHIANRPDSGLEVAGIFDDRATRVEESLAGQALKGDLDALLRFVRDNPVDEILVALPWTAAERLAEVLHKLKSVPLDVRLCPEDLGFRLPLRSFTSVAGVPMVNLFERPLSGWSLVAKAAEDRLCAALILLLSAPVMAAIALAIKIDSPGPVLFRQRRFGFNNNEFWVYKFRTMQPDALDGTGRLRQASRGDARVTRLGAVLRRTSMDELPQLWNVLRGDMSLVGPRPHAVAQNEEYGDIVDGYMSRHRVKPGITGWAQVNGFRGETETPEKMKQRVQYDLYYIDHWSLVFDIKILLLTLFVGFVHKNAY